jgi:hypothetical protein
VRGACGSVYTAQRPPPSRRSRRLRDVRSQRVTVGAGAGAGGELGAIPPAPAHVPYPGASSRHCSSSHHWWRTSAAAARPSAVSSRQSAGDHSGGGPSAVPIRRNRASSRARRRSLIRRLRTVFVCALRRAMTSSSPSTSRAPLPALLLAYRLGSGPLALQRTIRASRLHRPATAIRPAVPATATRAGYFVLHGLFPSWPGLHPHGRRRPAPLPAREDRHPPAHARYGAGGGAGGLPGHREPRAAPSLPAQGETAARPRPPPNGPSWEPIPARGLAFP